MFVYNVCLYFFSFIVVCESCHRQLFQQWEVFQKANKPITDRFYQLVRSVKQQQTITTTSTAVTTQNLHQVMETSQSKTRSSSPLVRCNSGSSSATANIFSHNPSISQQQSGSIAITTASQLAKQLFFCVICGKDLLYAAAQYSMGLVPPATNSHIAYSMLAEPDSMATPSLLNSVSSVKKLVVHSAQEMNLMPYLVVASAASASSNASATGHQLTAATQQQLSNLVESGRLLCCFGCFEAVTSQCSGVNVASAAVSNLPPNVSIINSNNIHSDNVGSVVRTVRDSLNGMHYCSFFSSKFSYLSPQQSHFSGNLKSSKLESSHLVNINATEITPTTTAAVATITGSQPPDLCLGCQYNKAQRFVETKETSSKDPFFPFLRDSNDLHGRARVCGACHLMLETQWDAFEAGYVPYSQRSYRLPSANSSIGSSLSLSSTTSSTLTPVSTNSFLITTKRSSTNSLLTSTNSATVFAGSEVTASLPMVLKGHPNGQATPPTPLKIQISSPSIVVPCTLTNNSESCQLLLTTVNSALTNSLVSQSLIPPPQQQLSSATSSVSVTNDNERIFHLINEFLAKLNGPLPVTTICSCTICQESIGNNEAYQVFSTSQKILISPELGLYPYFPMLKGMGVANIKKLKVDNTHVVCTFCYHSLIAQWAAYQLSAYPEDRDPNSRVYNLRDFICYVCGVTTYRTLVRSISVKDFPFLLEHKRPPGND